MIRARAGLVRARTALVNTARGLAKSYGERLRGCNVCNMNPEKAEGLSPELQTALEPLLAAIESLSERIREYNEGIERLAQESYPQVALLKQVKGVGTLIALTFLLTLEDAHRFRKSRYWHLLEKFENRLLGPTNLHFLPCERSGRTAFCKLGRDLRHR